MSDMVEADKTKHRVCCADCVIVRDNKILLQKRSFGMWEGYWCLPGGKVDHGETIIHGAIREAKEETNLDINKIRMLGIYDGKDRDPEQHGITIGFLCEANDAEPVMSDEATEMKFFPLGSLPENIAFDHGLIIEDARKLLDKTKKLLNPESD
jgi:8-oxo-dGTP diphosphatase